MRKLLLWTFMAALAVAAAGAPSRAAEITLKAATFLPVNQPFVVPFKHFVDKVNAEGKGVVQIRIVGGPEAMPGFQQPNAVKTGVLDMAVVPGTYYKGMLFEVEALQLATKTFKEQRESGAWEFINKLHQERMNVVYLANYGDNVRFHIYLLKKPTRPDRGGLPDLAGVKLRSTPVYDEFFKFLGATSTQIEAPEVLVALERGVVDGLGWPVLGLHDFGWQKHLKFRIDPGFYHTSVPIIVNLDRWKGLDKAQQDALMNAGIWLESESIKIFGEMAERDYKRQATDGIQSLDYGTAYVKRAEDVFWDALAKQSPELIPRLRPMLTK
jgi:TRAP-type C4-dicarboxylate transport system substrate-binding protein